MSLAHNLAPDGLRQYMAQNVIDVRVAEVLLFPDEAPIDEHPPHAFGASALEGSIPLKGMYTQA